MPTGVKYACPAMCAAFQEVVHKSRVQTIEFQASESSCAKPVNEFLRRVAEAFKNSENSRILFK